MSRIKLTISREDDQDLDGGIRDFINDLERLLTAAGLTVEYGEEMMNAAELLVERS